MDEERKQEQQDDPVHRISLKRHLWPDEVELRNAKKKVFRLKRLCVVFCAAGILAGWAAGSVLPLPRTGMIRNVLRSVTGISGSDKIEAVREILENDWYFAGGIEDLDSRLTDQAITGMTENSEDPHTEYMSEEEAEAFVQSINRDYVGIGAEYIMYSGRPMVTRVYDGSPAEKGGLQAGDVITAVGGESTDGLESTAIREKIQGPEGTDVQLTVLRSGSEEQVTITRGEVTATTFAEMLDSDLVYMQLSQFGEDTAETMRSYLEEMVAEDGSVSLILDLRGNGGGFLTSVQDAASLFLDKGDTVMIQEYADGTENTVKAKGGRIDAIHGIVILTDGGTASAAEVMTLALKENRSDVTVVGTTTYGKGTAQVSASFSDGSTLKYTASRWLSPDGEWINGTGIEPDRTVELPEAVTLSYPSMEEDETYARDSVGSPVAAMQQILSYFGLEPDRTDGYFSAKTEEKWKQFEEMHGMDADGIMTSQEYLAAVSEVVLDYHTSTEHDTQLQAALEILNG